jgi:hypothetical protein
MNYECGPLPLDRARHTSPLSLCRERNVLSVMNKNRPKRDNSLPVKHSDSTPDDEVGAERLRLQQLQAQVNELRQAIEEHFARLNATTDSGHRDGKG